MRKQLLLAAMIVGAASCSDVPTAPAPDSAPATFTPRAQRNSAAEPIANKYIVRFRDDEPNSAAHAKQLERTHGAVVERVYTSAIKGASMALADDAAEALRADNSVLSVEQDQTLSLNTTQTSPTWGIDRIDQRNLPLSNSYTYGPSGAGVTVYIIDTGINFTHNEYNGRASAGIDIITPNGTAADCNGHGSHVSGTVAGTTYGVAKSAKLVAVRVLDCAGNGTSSGVLAGVDWVTNHAVFPAVANMSLGGGFSATLNQGVTNSIAAGVVYAVAAGNSTADACNESPSSTPNAITVGATAINDGFASFSNFGTCVDINAPGVGITSAWMGSNSATNTISGTSMASPHVAGAAALFLSVNPGATPAQVRTALVGNATANAIAPAPPSGTPNLLLYTGFLNGAPAANFTSNCSSFSCTFDASSSTSTGTTTYAWTFGDAGTATGKVTSHTYGASGTFTVTLTVTDANGTSSKSSNVTVPVVGNAAPVASISTPANGTKLQQNALAAFAGAGNDAEDGALSGASLVWRSSINGQIGTGVTMASFGLSVGTHTITLTATDSKGATNTATSSLIIAAPSTNKPPVPQMSLPAPGASFTQGQTITFGGSGTDPEDGTLTGTSLVWSSPPIGAFGTGTSPSTSALPVGTHRIILTVTDANGLSAQTYRSVTVTAGASNQPPSASITAPANNSVALVGSSVSFSGSGSDPESGTLSGASLVWSSSINGQIGTGTSFSTSALSGGTHTITLTATDPQGATGTSSITLIVNRPPTANITSPTSGSSAPQGTSVSFAGTGTDPEDGTLTGTSLAWASSINGSIGSGTSFSTTSLSQGTHTITLTVTDSRGATTSTSVTLTITAPNQAPTANISAPTSGSSVAQGTSVSFAGTGTDPEDGALSGASLVWTSNINGQTGTGTSFSTSTLSVGTHTITLKVTDSQGAFGTATISITITGTSNQPPVAFIGSPKNALRFQKGTPLAFGGSGSDPEDGALSGASLVWKSSINGQFGTGVNVGASGLSAGTHTITLTATDSHGATATASVTITIANAGTNQPPTPTITGPALNSSFTQGTAVNFTGTGNDAEDGALSGASLVWTHASLGVIGTGTSFSTSALPVGSQRVYLTVTDSNGLSTQTWRTITITP